MTEFILRDSRKAGMVLHPSTECALEGLKSIQEMEAGNILDIGCGSGLLALAALELWPGARVLAADISPKAVEDAQANLAGRAQVVRADGFDHASIRQSAPYDLILCNLLADILIRVSPDVKAHLKSGGIAILSGILAWMLPQVKEAYASLGFEILGEIEIGEWRALLVGLS